MVITSTVVTVLAINVMMPIANLAVLALQHAVSARMDTPLSVANVLHVQVLTVALVLQLPLEHALLAQLAIPW